MCRFFFLLNHYFTPISFILWCRRHWLLLLLLISSIFFLAFVSIWFYESKKDNNNKSDGEKTSIHLSKNSTHWAHFKHRMKLIKKTNKQTFFVFFQILLNIEKQDKIFKLKWQNICWLIVAKVGKFLSENFNDHNDFVQFVKKNSNGTNFFCRIVREKKLNLIFNFISFHFFVAVKYNCMCVCGCVCVIMEIEIWNFFLLFLPLHLLAI